MMVFQSSSWAVGLITASLFFCSLNQLDAQIVNGSFETGDYTGWTLSEDSGVPSFGTWGIAPNGLTISSNDFTFDFYDGVLVEQYSPGLPITYFPSNGNFMAYQLQNSSENHRMWQDVTLAANASTLNWEMFYTNHHGAFDPFFQALSVNVRDLGDNILATLYTTTNADPLSIPMTTFSANISAFAGLTVRLDVEMRVQSFFFDAGFDNFRINAVPEPGSIALLSGIGIVGVVMTIRRKRKVVAS